MQVRNTQHPLSPPLANLSASPDPSKKQQTFTLYYQNVRGLRTKTNDLFLALSSSDYDIIAFSESWLHDEIQNSELAHNYTIYRCDRNSNTSSFMRGGGVLIGVRNGLQSASISIAECERLEQIVVRITLPNYELFVCAVYLPPNSETNLYEQHSTCVQKLLDLAGDHGRVLIVGDYNLPQLCWMHDEEINCFLPVNASSEQEIALVESIVSCGLYQINDLTNINGRLLDLVFINEDKCVELLEPPLPLMKIDHHHKPFVLKLETISKRDDVSASDPFDFDFNRCDFPALNELITAVRWDQCLNGCNINEAVSNFYQRVYSIVRDVVPRKKRYRYVGKRQPWWNNELQHLRNRLRKARKRYFRSKNEQHKAELRDLESNYNSLQARCFSCYIHRTEENIKQDPKSFWSFVRSRKQTNGIPQHVFYNEITAETTLDSANLFSSFFRSVLSNNRSPSSEAYLDSLPRYDLNVALFNFSPGDVLNKLQGIDGSKGAGPDRLSPLFIKNCAVSLSVPATILFNRSVAEGIFPSAWKTAAITPIHKAGSTHNIENYRGISILSCLPKVLESLIHDSLYPHVHHIISELQHGFVKKRSTTTNLMAYVSSLVNAMEKRQQIDAIYIDFTKAFDRVPHSLAVDKLDRMGLPAWLTRWMLSYLTERSAYVRINGTCSDSFDITSGVPQGSHLGPLLFVLFVNDLCKTIESPKVMYADDLKFFRVVSSLVECCAIQADIDALLRWCMLNGMEVNVRKCNVITFYRTRNPTVFDYRMSTTSIARVTTIKDLGVLLDSKLNFTQHIAATTAKAYAILGFIKRNAQQFEDVYCLKTLYCALVRSILEYGVLVWAPYQAVQINRIERIQRNFLRFALRLLPWNDPIRLPPYEHRCALLHLPTLANRRILLQRLFLFDILNNNVDCPVLLSNIPFNVPARSTRRADFFRFPVHRTLYGQNNPFEVCCRRFNEVFVDFDFNISKTMFRNRIS